MNESGTTETAQQQTSVTNSTCCEFFVDTLNKFTSWSTSDSAPSSPSSTSSSRHLYSVHFDTINSEESSQSDDSNTRQFLISPDFDFQDVESFLNYIQIWPQKQCVCVFSKEDLLERFHHFLHNLLTIGILVIRDLSTDHNLSNSITEPVVDARLWTMDQKEKLLVALIKVFTPNMPLYLAYRHLLMNHDRYSRNRSCSCSHLTQSDSLALIPAYCQSTGKSNSDLENLPIELLRNICLFVDLMGLQAIRMCLTNATPDNLPLGVAHLLFSIISHVRIWLNPVLIEKQIVPTRTHAINYMCLLCDKDLRLAGAKNTTEMMYEGFKSCFNREFYTIPSGECSSQENGSRNVSFRVDRDGLSLAYKYFTSSTLTIRLCGLTQMNSQITAWSEYSTMNNSNNLNGDQVSNDLADWFVENKIIEYLFGPNLHVEVIKQSQDIVNFLAFTNRLKENHIDAIWSAAQLKHCSKPAMDTLMSLHKHLNIDSLQYLLGLISKLDISQQNEQTLLLSALLTKNLWSILLEMESHKTRRRRDERLSSDASTNKKGDSSEFDSNNFVTSSKPQRITQRKNQSMETQMNCSEDDEEQINEEETASSSSSSSESSRSASPQPATRRYMTRRQTAEAKLLVEHHQLNEEEDSDSDSDYDEEEDEEDESEGSESDGSVDYQEIIQKKQKKAHRIDDDDDDDDDQESKFAEIMTAQHPQTSELINLLQMSNKFNSSKNDDIMDSINSVVNNNENQQNPECIYSTSSSSSNSLMNNKNKSTGECLTIDQVNRDFCRRKDNHDEENTESNRSSSIQMNPASVKNLNELDEELKENSTMDECVESPCPNDFHETIIPATLSASCSQSSNHSISSSKSSIKNQGEATISLKDICQVGNTFLWDLLTNESGETSTNCHVNGDASFTENENKDSSFSHQNGNVSQSSISDSQTPLLAYSPTTNTPHKSSNGLKTLRSASLSSNNSASSSSNNLTQRQKILKEAEKQLQTLLCFPNIDRRIRLEFIESCIHNLGHNKSVHVSLRLLTKLLNSFQQYCNHTSSNSSAAMNYNFKCKTSGPATNSLSKTQLNLLAVSKMCSNRQLQSHFNTPLGVLEVHKIVAWCECQYGLVQTFFDSLVEYTRLELAALNKCGANNERARLDILLQVRSNIQSRLSFLSFLYSTFGSPRDFELSTQHVECLWDSLTQFSDFSIRESVKNAESTVTTVSIRDDLFNWLLVQAKNKDQHAITIDKFKFLFINKIPQLDPNSLSLNALQLYQELFKIYKMSFQMQPSDNGDESHFKQIEASAIDYITKLAFNSADNDVSLAAIQFLNSHYTQADTISNPEYQNQFVNNCMGYLNESRLAITAHQKISNGSESGTRVDELLNQIQRGLFLLKNHLDLFQKRNSYQLRLIKIANAFESHQQENLQSHLKLLEQVDEESRLFSFQPMPTETNESNTTPNLRSIFSSSSPSNTIKLVCHINATQFKFNLIMSSNDCVGDLKGLIREIFVRIVKSGETVEPRLEHLLKQFKSQCASSSNNKFITFNSSHLTNPVMADYNREQFAKAYCILDALNGKEMATLAKLIKENENDLYVRISFNHGQSELTTMGSSMTMDSKTIQEAGLADMHSLQLSLYTRSNQESGQPVVVNNKQLDKNCIPMLILSRDPHFSNLFHLVSLTSSFNALDDEKETKSDETMMLRKRCLNLSLKLWKIIVLIPADKSHLSAITSRPDTHLSIIIQRLSEASREQTDSSLRIFDSLSLDSTPYQLLYYMQLIQIALKQKRSDSEILERELEECDEVNYETLMSQRLYQLVQIIVKHIIKQKKYCKTLEQTLFGSSTTSSCLSHNLNSDVLLDCVMIAIRLLCGQLFTVRVNQESVGSNEARKSVDANTEHEEDEMKDDSLTETKNGIESNHRRPSWPSNRPELQHNTQLSPYKSSYFARLISSPHLKLDLFNKVIGTSQHEFLSLMIDVQILAALGTNVVTFYNSNSNQFANTSLELLFSSMQLVTGYLFSSVSSSQEVANELARHKSWLKCLLLLEHFRTFGNDTIDLNVAFRREACAWIFSLCAREDDENEEQNSVLNSTRRVLLGELISLISLAVKSKPITSNNSTSLTTSSIGGSYLTTRTRINCKDYFHLLSNLFDRPIVNQMAKLVSTDSSTLLEFVFTELRSREIYESVSGSTIIESYQEDDVLVGLLSLGVKLVKYHAENNSRPIDETLTHIDELYGYLFNLSTNETNLKISLPKFRSNSSRSLGFELLLELAKLSPTSYEHVFQKVVKLGMGYTDDESKANRPLRLYNPILNQIICDYWPREDIKSPCGYVGLVNLGATCYMATAMQHLFMIKEARQCILNTTESSESGEDKNEAMLSELRRMYAHLQLSEKRAYSPRDFCKVYVMDQQPLNTSEQKDMQEFFTDLISKLEESRSSPALKQVIKSLFGGQITNVVVSLDCEHVSRTLEDFYTVRCQVSGMRDLYDALNEICVKDTLDGDNMYTCSTCLRKVRAEKRACFRQLPQILCFNTMRYTFNMITMLKEKINTHFSFPMQLDMSGYMEKTLVGQRLDIEDHLEDEQADEDEDVSYIYDLIGVTVHTGTAEGGHYYSFIKDRSTSDQEVEDEEKNKWFFFNDADVKQFDPSQLPGECFGGETTSKTYDSSTDKFMDMSYEKTNSAYMLFYERRQPASKCLSVSLQEQSQPESTVKLLKSIWNDNLQFLADRLTFDPSYFNFMWQMCSSLTAHHASPHVALKATQLGIHHLLDTYVHSKDKSLMNEWNSLLIKLLEDESKASQWLLEHLIETEMHWAIKILLRCSNMSVRLVFQRFVLAACSSLIKNESKSNWSLIERFITKLLDLMNYALSNKCNVKCMSEYFGLLTELIKQHDNTDIVVILLKLNCVQRLTNFYVLNRQPVSSNPETNGVNGDSKSEKVKNGPENESEEMVEEEDIDEDEQPDLDEETTLDADEIEKEQANETDEDVISSQILPLLEQKSKLKVYERCIALISLVLETFINKLASSGSQQLEQIRRSVDFKIKLIFFYRAISDELNMTHLRSIILSVFELNQQPRTSTRLSRENKKLAIRFLNMCCTSIKRLQEKSSSSGSGESEKSKKSNGTVATPTSRLGDVNCLSFFNVLRVLLRAESESDDSDETGESTAIIGQIQMCDEATASRNLVSKLVADYMTDLIVKNKLDFLLHQCQPIFTLEWLCILAGQNVPINKWLLSNISSWVRDMLVVHRNMNVRYKTACLLAQLVPNRQFGHGYTHGRGLLPFIPTSTSPNIAQQSTLPPELNLGFETPECKSVLHKIIKYLLSLMTDTEPSLKSLIQPVEQKVNTSRLMQYFIFLTYSMTSNDEKELFFPFIDSFWSLFHSCMANHHMAGNLNKFMASHFFYHAILDCELNLDYILRTRMEEVSEEDDDFEDEDDQEVEEIQESSTETTDRRASTNVGHVKRAVFESVITRELPLCTVVVDHEDSELISYNKNCLHAYYATIRALCEHSVAYSRLLSTHTNMNWAFKNVLPYYAHYPLAVQELNKCIYLFAHLDNPRRLEDNENSESSSDEEATSSTRTVSTKLRNDMIAFKENLLNLLLMGSNLEIKQGWQSILLCMKSLIDNVDDATIVITKRGLSALTLCFYQIWLLHHQHNHHHHETNTSGMTHQVLDAIVLLTTLCNAITHHLDKKSDGIKQVVQAWKEKNELCKRLLCLVNFTNTSEVRDKALCLVKKIIIISLHVPQITDTLAGHMSFGMVNIIFNSFFNSTHSQTLLAYSMPSQNACMNKQQQSGTSNNTLTQCSSMAHMYHTILGLMGTQFPLNKKLTPAQIQSYVKTFNSMTGANSGNGGASLGPRSGFNMYLPVMFVSHGHLYGSVWLYAPTTNSDYKDLFETYYSFLDFIIWLSKNVFSRFLSAYTRQENSTSLPTTSSHQSPAKNELSTPLQQLVDIILVIQQNAFILNFTELIDVLNKYMTRKEVASDEEEEKLIIDLVGEEELNQSPISLILQSPRLGPFVNILLMHYPYLLEKQEVYKFMHTILPKYFYQEACDNENERNVIGPRITNQKSETKTSVLAILRPYLERACYSLNESRFFFEFNSLVKPLVKQIESFDESSTPSLEQRCMQIMGNIKSLRLLLICVLEESKSEDQFDLYKTRREIKNLVGDIVKYLKTQMSEMDQFLNEKNEPDEEDDEECSKSKKIKLDESQMSPTNPIRESIIKQINSKKKHLESIIEVLDQLVAEIAISSIVNEPSPRDDDDVEIIEPDDNDDSNEIIISI